MKKKKERNINIYTLILVFALVIIIIILIKSKAPQVDIDVAQPVEEQEEIIEEEFEESEAEEIVLEENTIEIKPDAFYPAEKTIEKNTEIKWLKKDTRDYKIVCYLGGTRVIQSPDLKQGDFFTYAFLKEGQYTCITVPYGLRSTIIVEAKTALLSPTGSAVIGKKESIKVAPLAAIALIATVVLLFFIYGRKR